MLMSRSSDELDGVTKKECSICLYDLHLSSVSCSCSPDRHSCLRHSKELCSCSWSAKHVFFRYEITDLTLLVEALEGNLKAIHSLAKRKGRHVISMCSSYVQNKSCSPANNRANEENKSTKDSDTSNGMNMKACSRIVTTGSGVSGGANKEGVIIKCTSPPGVTSLRNANRSASDLSTLPLTRNEVTSQPDVVILVSEDEDELS